MNSKIVLITGATSGIGKETTRGLAQLGATIIIAARDKTKAKQTKSELIKSTNNKNIDFIPCDLASFKSIRKCAQEFKTKYNRLDILINNAGIWDFRRRETADGIENIFQTNYLAPFLLTNLLLDTLKASAPSRIINVVSGLQSGTIHFDDLEFKNKFSGMKAYSHSKLALILFTRLLAKKLEGTGVTVNCVQPGMTRTELGRDAPGFQRVFFKLFGKDPKKGAETSIYLASSKDVENITGEYFEKKKIQRSSEESYDMDVAERLWDVSVKYVQL